MSCGQRMGWSRVLSGEFSTGRALHRRATCGTDVDNRDAHGTLWTAVMRSTCSSSRRHVDVTIVCGRPRRCRAVARASSVGRSPGRPHRHARASRPTATHRGAGPPRGHPSGPRGDDSEAHVSAEPAPPGEEARIPRAHVHPRRPDDPPGPTATRKAEAVGLIGGIRGRRTFDELQRHGRRTAAGTGQYQGV